MEASKILEKQWERWPEENRFGTKLLSCALSLEDPERARSVFDQLVDNKRKTVTKASEALKTLLNELSEKEKCEREEAERKGESYVPKEHPKSVSQKIRKLRAQAGTNPHALAFLAGSVLTLEGKHEEALAQLQSAEAVQTANRPDLYSKMGSIHIKLKNYAEAERCYNQVLDLAPNSHDAHLGLAQIALDQKSYYKAAGEALASLELIFHNPKAHTLYGTALIHLKSFKIAEETLLTAVVQNPNYFPAHLQLVNLYKGPLNKPEKATQHQEWAEQAKINIAKIKKGEQGQKKPTAEFPTIEACLNRLSPSDGEPLIVVSGLPRSGTSLMMQMLRAGGLNVVSDENRPADESNPKGYFEDDRIKKLPSTKNRSWLNEYQGQAIKIVAPLLGLIPKNIPLKIIFMQRNTNELITSQRTMLERDHKMGAATDDDSLARVFAAQLEGVNLFGQQRSNVEILPIQFAEAIENPQAIAAQVTSFINSKLDPKAMALATDKSLYRTKIE